MSKFDDSGLEKQLDIQKNVNQNGTRSAKFATSHRQIHLGDDAGDRGWKIGHKFGFWRWSLTYQQKSFSKLPGSFPSRYLFLVHRSFQVDDYSQALSEVWPRDGGEFWVILWGGSSRASPRHLPKFPHSSLLRSYGQVELAPGLYLAAWRASQSPKLRLLQRVSLWACGIFDATRQAPLFRHFGPMQKVCATVEE